MLGELDALEGRLLRPSRGVTGGRGPVPGAPGAGCGDSARRRMGDPASKRSLRGVSHRDLGALKCRKPVVSRVGEVSF